MAQSETVLAAETERSPFVGRDAWIDRAVCRDVEADWFPDAHTFVGSGAYKQAKRRLDAICVACPVQAECLEEALRLDTKTDGYGVRAGTTQHERERLRRLL